MFYLKHMVLRSSMTSDYFIYHPAAKEGDKWAGEGEEKQRPTFSCVSQGGKLVWTYRHYCHHHYQSGQNRAAKYYSLYSSHSSDFVTAR